MHPPTRDPWLRERDARLGSPLEGARRRGCETLGASGAAEWAWRVNKEPYKEELGGVFCSL